LGVRTGGALLVRPDGVPAGSLASGDAATAMLHRAVRAALAGGSERAPQPARSRRRALLPDDYYLLLPQVSHD